MRLSVVLKPRVEGLENVTVAAGPATVSLTCTASGDPLPRITWRKWSNRSTLLESSSMTLILPLVLTNHTALHCHLSAPFLPLSLLHITTYLIVVSDNLNSRL